MCTLTWNSIKQLKVEYETDKMMTYIKNVVHSMATILSLIAVCFVTGCKIKLHSVDLTVI